MSSVVAAVPNLMDRSKIESAVDGVQFVSSVSNVPEDFRGYLVVDIGRPGVVEELSQRNLDGVNVIAFAGHLERETLAAARALGCNVKTRGQFFSALPSLD